MAETTRPAPTGYYAARSRRLLRGFDRFARRVRGPLAVRFGEAQADLVLADARAELERLIPEIPYIGGRRNVFSWVMIVNGWMVALHRAVVRHGGGARDTVRACADTVDALIRAIPRPVLRLIRWLAFSPLVQAVFRRQAARSQERRYPEDFVYRLETGGEDDWALVFEECAVNKFYRAQRVPELAPYCNFVDVSYARLLGMGLDARETIGLGCARCRLRYQRGRETPMPPALEGVLPEAAPRI